MNIPDHGRPRGGDIDMVPMINFVFLLLIFFMLSGSFTNDDTLGVKAPESSASTPSELTASIVLLAADGRIAFGTELIPDAHLYGRAAQWRSENIGGLLQVKADAGVTAQRVVEVLETLRAAGVDRVTLLTTRAPGSS